MEVVHRAEEEEASSRVNFPLNTQSYNLLTEISSGPQAVVYKAECFPSNSELVAIKSIDFDRRLAYISLVDVVGGAEVLTSSLSHPNVVSAHCSFMAEDEKYWVVMPFFLGGSVLSVMYDSQFGYSEALVSVVLREVLKGLVYLHGQDKYHGDLKTGNILLGPNGSVMLADYGVSESWYDLDSGRFRPTLDATTGNDVPYWVPPEKIVYSPKWDIWAVGIVALEMSYGRPPLSQLPGTESLLLRIRKRFGSWKYEKTAERNLWIFSEEFKDMVSLCLDQDLTKRPSAEDLLKHPFFLKYDKMGPDVIERYLVQGFPSVEERRSSKAKVSGTRATTISGTKRVNDSKEGKNDNEKGEEKANDDKIPDYLGFTTRRQCHPVFETESENDWLVRRINEWNLNAAAAESAQMSGGGTRSTSSENGGAEAGQSGTDDLFPMFLEDVKGEQRDLAMAILASTHQVPKLSRERGNG
ncbi:LOW QUALITY PROTEIN: Serine/threonine protein kinase [Trema orientale]|uniref:Serine/threonine protein kinase n=1 Tax=Trema orientale TaxID=63057 RepID=A0A2P5ECU9_TREOI|nr:LOW QUALITY PROTEIN: Serine/threonine protein kinase [Trema orientale]